MTSDRSDLLDAFAGEATRPAEIDDSYAFPVTATITDPATTTEPATELVGITVDDAYAAFFNGAPRWVGHLMTLRNKIVGRLGFDVGHAASGRPTTSPVVGDVVGVFEIMDRTASEILMGNDDAHFRFRVSLQVLDSPTRSGQVMSVTTVGYSLTTLGRIYLRIVRPFHAIVAKRMTRSIAAALHQPSA